MSQPTSTRPNIACTGSRFRSNSPTVSLEDIRRQLDSHQFSPSGMLSLSGITPLVFEKLMDELENFPELENLRFDYRKHEDLLIYYTPSIGHEIMAPLHEQFSLQKPEDVIFGGRSMTLLNDGAKCPDFSIYSDDNPEVSKRFRAGDGREHILAFPTVVVEVGYSDKLQDLAKDCGRWIACSLGRVRLAVGIHIDHRFDKGVDGEGLNRVLASIHCITWTIEKVDIHVSELLPGEELDQLRRTDGQMDGAALKYSCLSLIGEELYRLHAVQQHKFQVFPNDPQETYDSIRIRRKHVYRTKSPNPNLVVFDIKFQEILAAVSSQHELQVLVDHMAEADSYSFTQDMAALMDDLPWYDSDEIENSEA